jgi:asparagine synthetase B (glutamine-hydrolysing)
MGVKPLYWWSDGNALLFASEMKAMLRHPALRNRKVNRADSGSGSIRPVSSHGPFFVADVSIL